MPVTKYKKQEKEKNSLQNYRDFVIKKLSHLAPYLQRAAMGDFRKKIKISQEEDEFTELAVSVNLMIEDLEELQKENKQNERELKKAKDECEIEVEKRTEDLAKSEALLSSIIDQSPFSTWIADEKGFNIRQNQACRELFGIKDDRTVIGKYNLFKDNVLKEKGFIPEIKKVFEKGKTANFRVDYPFALVKHIKVPGAKRVMIDMTVFPIKNNKGKVINAVIQHKDITKEFFAEEQLKQEKYFSQNILDTAQTIVLVLDTNAQIVFYNSFLENLSGFKLSKNKGKNWFDTFLPKADYTKVKRVFKSALSGKRTQGNINFIVTKKGESRSIEWYDKALRNEKGEITGLLVTGYDVTKRLKIEKELQVSEERFELAMKGADDGLWDWDTKTSEVYYSPRWKSMLGYKDNEIKNSFDEFAKRLHPEDAERVTAYVNRYVASGGKGKFEHEFRMEHKKGNYIDILARAFAQVDKKGKVLRLVGTHVDLSDRKKSEHVLEEKLGELEKINKLMIGRELKMVELKNEIKELKDNI